MDGWDWIAKTTSYGVPTIDDGPYYLSKDALDGTFNPKTWIIATQCQNFSLIFW